MGKVRGGGGGMDEKREGVRCEMEKGIGVMEFKLEREVLKKDGEWKMKEGCVFEDMD